MLLPLTLAILAILLAAAVAYGTESSIGSMSGHGLDIILWSRRIEWPLVITSILLCIGLVVLVVSGRRRAWWLLGLLPVLALFTHRFITSPALRFHSVDNPMMVPGDQAGFVGPSDEIVGMTRDDVDYAFPYAVLYRNPVVVQSDRAGVMVLIWSPMANRALAFSADRDLRARDLEIVSSPCNALIVFNSRLGQFINGVTGRTPDGGVPTGFLQPITVTKTTWRDWIGRHAKTVMVMLPQSTDWQSAPRDPIEPVYSAPSAHGVLPGDRKVCLVAATQPIAVPSEMVTAQPLNLVSGQISILLVRLSSGAVRAYSRQLPLDLVPRFTTCTDARHKSVAWKDTDTGSEWSIGGEVLEGPKEMMHARLAPLPVEDEVYLGVIQYWNPTLRVVTTEEAAASTAVDQPPHETKPITKHKIRK